MSGIQLQANTGFNGVLSGGVRAIPSAHEFVCVSGGQLVISGYNGSQRYLQGHDDRITAFGLSTSGRLAASGQQGRNADVVIWDFQTGSIRSRFQEHDVEVVQLTFSLDDRLLLTIGHENDPRLFVLDTSTGKIVSNMLLPHKKLATASAFAPLGGQGYTFAVSTQCGEVHIFSLDPYGGFLSGSKVTPGSIRRSFTCMVFSADSQWLYVGTTSGDVVTVNVMRRTMQMAHPACSAGVGAISLSSSGRLLVGGGNGSLTLFTNDHMWKDIVPFATVPGPVTSLSATSDGAALIVGTSTGGIYRVLNSNSGITVLKRSHYGPVRGVSALAGDPSCLVTCSDDGTVSMWTLLDPQAPPLTQLQVFKADAPMAGAALSVAVTGDSVISGWSDGILRCHARGGGSAPTWVIPGAHALAHSTGATAIKISNRSTFMVTGGAGGEVRAWDLRSRQMVSNMKAHSAPICDLAVLSDDAHIVTASLDRSWSLWDLHPECSRASWRVNTIINGMAVCPDQMTVITVGQDKQAMIWDIRSPSVVRTFEGIHQAEPGCVAVSPNRSMFVTGAADGEVKLWDLSSGALLGSAIGHSGPVSKLMFTQAASQDQPLVSVSLDGSISFWHLPGLA